MSEVRCLVVWHVGLLRLVGVLWIPVRVLVLERSLILERALLPLPLRGLVPKRRLVQERALLLKRRLAPLLLPRHLALLLFRLPVYSWGSTCGCAS